MLHPQSKDVRRVITLFESVLPLATRSNHLSMACIRVNVDHECGTIHCHAGWFAVATKIHLKKKDVWFNDGTVAMKDMLGFDCVANLQEWAQNNVNIWGNIYGGEIFLTPRAFLHRTRRPFGARNLQDIIDHWSEVATRLQALEQPIEISEPPVTVEDVLVEECALV